MLYDDLKKANMQAMKDKNTVARGIYSIIINKCMLLTVEKREKGLTLTDEDVLQLINKTIKEVEDEKESFKLAGREEQVKVLQEQIDILMAYLPKQLTREEIENEISKLDDKSMPNVMKYFKMNFAGKCDMKLVSQIAKEIK